MTDESLLDITNDQWQWPLIFFSEGLFTFLRSIDLFWADNKCSSSTKIFSTFLSIIFSHFQRNEEKYYHYSQQIRTWLVFSQINSYSIMEKYNIFFSIDLFIFRFLTFFVIKEWKIVCRLKKCHSSRQYYHWRYFKIFTIKVDYEYLQFCWITSINSCKYHANFSRFLPTKVHLPYQHSIANFVFQVKLILSILWLITINSLVKFIISTNFII